jgi:ABC-type transport system involved in cytochrome bd biosynthesis fused ATPase/permease subunit
MIRARRRMLWMLLVLAVAAIAMAYLGLAAWWIAVPPVVLLAGYLLLLREAAQADAEARARQAQEQSAAMARREREAQQAQQAREAQQAVDARRRTGTTSSPAWPGHETLPPAEIIDISERVGDQLYDQYADAHLRAVGD